ncbi:MAG: GGDEF domain-containing phosphodiesterase [Eubacterium sp.]|nr:GGDEF domain-containing phosphodiesterase [Eubacterium sp.]
MALDKQLYATILEEFLMDIGRIQDVHHPDMMEGIEKICSFLRIGRIESDFYVNIHQEIRHAGEKNIIYGREGFSIQNKLEKSREVTKEGNVLSISSYLAKGEEDWTKEERQKVQMLNMILLAYFGRNRTNQLAEELVFQDADLGIYNHEFFLHIIREYMKAGELTQYIAGYFNIKRFSIVNQQLGRERGTDVMREYVTSLQKQLGDKGYVCRVTGDNFEIIFKKQCLDMVMNHLERACIFYEQGSDDYVVLESGVGFYEVKDVNFFMTPNDVVDRITAAYRVAAAQGRDFYVFFNDEMNQKMVRDKKIESEFHGALEREEFLVYYQPKVNLKDYTLEGAEALCRWRRNVKLIPPFHFIPVLEQSYAICELDFYMLEHVCKDLRQWMDEGKDVVRISVNFSRQHMGNDNLSDRIIQIIDKYQIPHNYIEVELTETTTDVEFKDLRQLVLDLRENGVSTAVDDFGVGYSSLNLIRELPWDVLKVDKSFLPDSIDSSNQKYVMFKHLIGMAQNLGLECIVEGVETVDHVRILKENHCYMAQGFYFDKPLPKEDFALRLERKQGE